MPRRIITVLILDLTHVMQARVDFALGFDLLRNKLPN